VYIQSVAKNMDIVTCPLISVYVTDISTVVTRRLRKQIIQ